MIEIECDARATGTPLAHFWSVCVGTGRANEGLRPFAEFLVETLDARHGNALAAWQEMGAPEAPAREQTAALRDAAHGTHRETVTADSQGCLRVQHKMQSWSIVLLTEILPT